MSVRRPKQVCLRTGRVRACAIWIEVTYIALRVQVRRDSWNAVYSSNLAPTNDVPCFVSPNGDARSGTHDPADVKRLQLLALIEDEGPFIHMTAFGKQRVERLESR